MEMTCSRPGELSYDFQMWLLVHDFPQKLAVLISLYTHTHTHTADSGFYLIGIVWATDEGEEKGERIDSGIRNFSLLGP